FDEGCGVLKQRLETSNYVVRGLRFSPAAGAAGSTPDIVTSNRVPDDAAIVVIAGPREPLPDYALKALREYMTPTDPAKKQGKLMVMLDTTLSPDKSGLVRTGLEPLLAEFGVQAGNNRVLQLRAQATRTPTEVIATANPDEGVRTQNPIAAAFQRFGF